MKKLLLILGLLTSIATCVFADDWKEDPNSPSYTENTYTTNANLFIAPYASPRYDLTLNRNLVILDSILGDVEYNADLTDDVTKWVDVTYPNLDTDGTDDLLNNADDTTSGSLWAVNYYASGDVVVTDDIFADQITAQAGNGSIIALPAAGAIIVKDDVGTGGYISFGANSASLGLSRDGTVDGYDYDGAFIFEQQGTDADEYGEFIWIEENGNWRFALPKSQAGMGTYNPRSMIIAGPSVNTRNNFIGTYWGFDKIDMATSATGADLGVQDDVEINGTAWIDENLTVASTVWANGKMLISKDDLTPTGAVANGSTNLVTADTVYDAGYITTTTLESLSTPVTTSSTLAGATIDTGYGAKEVGQDTLTTSDMTLKSLRASDILSCNSNLTVLDRIWAQNDISVRDTNGEADVSIYGYEASSAKLYMYRDEGDDGNADKFYIDSRADGLVTFVNNNLTNLTLELAGNMRSSYGLAIGALTVSGNVNGNVTMASGSLDVSKDTTCRSVIYSDEWNSLSTGGYLAVDGDVTMSDNLSVNNALFVNSGVSMLRLAVDLTTDGTDLYWKGTKLN